LLAEAALTQRLQLQALEQFGSLPAGVDLIVMRQERTSAAKVAATAAKVSAAGAAPLAPLSSGPSAPLPSSALALPPAAAISSADFPRLWQQLQGALTAQAVASFFYYRDIAFAATLCGEFSDIEAADNALANAALYAAASKSLHDIVAGQGSPTSAEALASFLAQAKRAVPHIEAAQAAAKTAKDYAKAAELQELRLGVVFVRRSSGRCHLFYRTLLFQGISARFGPQS
jgi:hypothetical protein